MCDPFSAVWVRILLKFFTLVTIKNAPSLHLMLGRLTRACT